MTLWFWQTYFMFCVSAFVWMFCFRYIFIRCMCFYLSTSTKTCNCNKLLLYKLIVLDIYAPATRHFVIWFEFVAFLLLVISSIYRHHNHLACFFNRNVLMNSNRKTILLLVQIQTQIIQLKAKPTTEHLCQMDRDVIAKQTYVIRWI